MIISPYNLESESKNKTEFYDQLSVFTDQVVEFGNAGFDQLLSEYEVFANRQQIKTYQHDEYLMELLMIGVFFNNYKSFLSKTAFIYQPLFNGLYQLRKQFPKIKPGVDTIRGFLSSKLLLKNRKKPVPKIKELSFLISWLYNTKEFDQEVERIKLWNQFLMQKNAKMQNQIWNEILEFAQWFKILGEQELGRYTRDWSAFNSEFAASYKNREDRIFCSREPIEYHLNMVTAEVMNRALKPGFSKTKRKIILVPTCMKKSEQCKARVVNNQLICQHCQPDCNISDLTLTMNKKGVTTVMIPHSSGFSTYLKPWKDSKETALIGVACVLNLVTGGYEMQKLNIPSQCVFLNRCGCKKHWLSGQSTSLNINQLNRLLDNEPVKSYQPSTYSTC